MAREIISWAEWAGLWPEQAATKMAPAARVFQEVRTGPAAGYAEAVKGWSFANLQTLEDGKLYHAPHGPGAGGAIIWQTNLLGEVVAGIYYAPDGPYIVQPVDDAFPDEITVPSNSMVIVDNVGVARHYAVDGTLTWSRDCLAAIVAAFPGLDLATATGFREAGTPPIATPWGTVAIVAAVLQDDGVTYPWQYKHFLIQLRAATGAVVSTALVPDYLLAAAYNDDPVTGGYEFDESWVLPQLAASEDAIFLWDGFDAIHKFSEAGAAAANSIRIYDPIPDLDEHLYTRPNPDFLLCNAFFWQDGTLHLVEMWGAAKHGTGAWRRWNENLVEQGAVALTDAPVFAGNAAQLASDAEDAEPFDNVSGGPAFNLGLLAEPGLWAENLDEIWGLDVAAGTFDRTAGTPFGTDELIPMWCAGPAKNGKMVYVFYDNDAHIRTLAPDGTWSDALTIGSIDNMVVGMAGLEEGAVAIVTVASGAGTLRIVDVSGATPALSASHAIAGAYGGASNNVFKAIGATPNFVEASA